MKSVVAVMACALMLSGCLAGNMARGLSLKGKPLADVERHYGQPAGSEPVADGRRYSWNAHDDDRPCTLMVVADAAGRVTDVKMVGKNSDCYAFRK